MEGSLPVVSFASVRPFGAEVEVNAFDGRDRPEVEGDQPLGMDYVGSLIAHSTKSYVEVRKWNHTHGNSIWVVKPDGSCGLEVCSPVLRGLRGVAAVGRVVEALAGDEMVTADERCSLHVHVGVPGVPWDRLGAILAWWVKCEACILEAMPAGRRRNRFCRQIGLTDAVSHKGGITPEGLVRLLGQNKYWTANSFHLIQGNRSTLEFRVMDGGACLNAYDCRNWVMLVLHFVERALGRGWPEPYREDDPFSSFLWLDPRGVLRFLGFDGPVCPVLARVRDWLLGRWAVPREALGGAWDAAARAGARREVRELLTNQKEMSDDQVGREPDLGRAAR